jgi:NADPH-dependent ferric siderophore reductase
MSSLSIVGLRGGTHLIIQSGVPGVATLDFIVDEIDEARTVLEAEGASPTAIRRGNPHDRFVATDPEGNTLVVNSDHSMGVVPFGPEDLDGVADEFRPRPRRFTIREWDPRHEMLSIDFVTHGDMGYAGRWAQRAQPGDRLQFEGPGGSYRPSSDVDWHLYVGDESAFGAIGASLQAL